MKASETKTMRLVDYRPPEFTTDEVDLDFDIGDDHTIVTSKVTYRRTADDKGSTELVLDAENPNPGEKYILSVTVDGVPLAEGAGGYTYDKENDKLHIDLYAGQDDIEVEIKTYLEPENNTNLDGFYQTDSCVVTQCESEGFRRITPFLDRPDVMAAYKVRITADEADFPVLLSNGNKTGEGTLPGNRHWAEFTDPTPKPCYLFATANGKLEYIEDVFITMSGRKVDLRIFTEIGDKEKGRFALSILKKALKWDEEVNNQEYKLGVYNIVAVAKFNAGAMENRGLNIFRDAAVLADPETATDADYLRIAKTVAHEFMHDKSGNEVTIRDWFQVSLKEGLTTAREQMFIADLTSPATQRIGAVQSLRASQFVEDDGPLAHSVQPQEVESIDNCYSGTIYGKGAEIKRMMRVMMGDQKFSGALQDYFRVNSGKAVTIDELIASMEKISGLDLSGQFHKWYTQSGRPRVKAEGKYDPVAQTYTLTLEQHTPPTKDQPIKEPMYIPVKMGLVDGNGNDMPLVLDSDDTNMPDSGDTERILHFTKEKQTFTFKNVTQEPAFHSLFRDFSAPVSVDPGLSEDQLHEQLLHDTDGFNRWDAGQKLALAEMERLYDGYMTTGRMPAVDTRYLQTLKRLADDPAADPALVAKAFSMPGIKELESAVKPVKPSAIAAVRKHLRKTIGNELEQDFVNIFNNSYDPTIPYSFDHASIAARSLRSVALAYLSANDNKRAPEMQKLYFAANNMTDRIMAMTSLMDHMGPERDAVFDAFYKRFKDDQLTIQKWFVMQAQSDTDDITDRLTEITDHNVFDWENPGHLGSLFSGFAGNYNQFHRADGNGYKFLADSVLKIDKDNPMTAANIVGPLCNWRNYTEDHQKLMIAQLERISAEPDLSDNVKDKVSKALPDNGERKTLGMPVPSGP